MSLSKMNLQKARQDQSFDNSVLDVEINEQKKLSVINEDLIALPKQNQKALERERNYELRAKQWEDFVNIPASQTAAGNFGEMNSYAEVLDLFEKLEHSEKNANTKHILKHKKDFRMMAKAYFANRRIEGKLEGHSYANTHNRLLNNEIDLLSTSRFLRKDSADFNNLKDSVKKLREIRDTEILLQNVDSQFISDIVLSFKIKMDQAMDRAIVNCRKYMKHVDDPNSPAGKERLRLTSEILRDLQLEKNTSDGLKYDDMSICKGAAAYTRAGRMRWNDLIESMLTTDSMFEGGTELEKEENKEVDAWLKRDCKQKPKTKPHPDAPRFGTVGLNYSDTELYKIIMRSARAKKTMQLPHTNLSAPDVLGIYAMGRARKDLFFFDQSGNELMTEGFDINKIGDDDYLEELGISADQKDAFRKDVEDLQRLANESSKTFNYMFLNYNNMSSPFEKGYLGIEENDRKYGNTRKMMEDIKSIANDDYNTFEGYKTVVSNSLMKNYSYNMGKLLAKYNLNIALLDRDREIAYKKAHSTDTSSDGKIALYPKQKEDYDNVRKELDLATSKITEKEITIGNVQLKLPANKNNPLFSFNPARELTEEEKQELMDLTKEYGEVSKKALVYTDFRNCIVDLEDAFVSETEVDRMDYFKAHSKEIEEKYGKSVEYKECQDDMKKVFDKFQKKNFSLTPKLPDIEGKEIGVAEDEKRDILEKIEEIERQKRLKELKSFDQDLDATFAAHNLDVYGLTEEKILSLTFEIKGEKAQEMVDKLYDSLTEDQVNKYYEFYCLDEDYVSVKTQKEDERKNQVATRLVKSLGVLVEKMEIAGAKQTYMGNIVSDAEKKLRDQYDFENKFEELAKADYSKEFIKKYPKWLISGKGKADCFRFDLYNRQMYYKTRSKELENQIVSFINKVGQKKIS